MTELKDLVGLNMRDAVDFEQISVSAWEVCYPEDVEDASCCRFRIDSAVYAAVADPSDG